MEKRNYTYAQLGMLFGIFIGGGLSVVLFGITGDAVYFGVAGAGTAIGLILGAGLDRQKASKKDQ
jgi:hypothetical protein